MDADHSHMFNNNCTIHGLDISVGLDLVGGQMEDFIALLNIFMEHHGDDMTKLELILEKGDTHNAILLTHSLRGSTSVLGMSEIYTQANELEVALKAGYSKIAINKLVVPLSLTMAKMFQDLKLGLTSSY